MGCGTKLLAQLVLFGAAFCRHLDFILLGLALEFVGDLVTVVLINSLGSNNEPTNSLEFVGDLVTVVLINSLSSNNETS